MKKIIVLFLVAFFPVTVKAQALGCFEEWRSGANGNCSLNTIVCDLADPQANYNLFGFTIGSLCESQVRLRNRIKRNARLIRTLKRRMAVASKR